MNTPAAEIDSTLEELRIAALVRQAPLEFARVVYGLNDRANGRAGTMAAEDVARTVRQGVPVTRERAEQRARGLPSAGRAGALPALLGVPRHQEPAELPRSHRRAPRVRRLQGLRRGIRHHARLAESAARPRRPRDFPVRVNLGAVQQSRSLEWLARRAAQPEGVPSAEQEVRRQAGAAGDQEVPEPPALRHRNLQPTSRSPRSSSW